MEGKRRPDLARGEPALHSSTWSSSCPNVAALSPLRRGRRQRPPGWISPTAVVGLYLRRRVKSKSARGREAILSRLRMAARRWRRSNTTSLARGASGNRSSIRISCAGPQRVDHDRRRAIDSRTAHMHPRSTRSTPRTPAAGPDQPQAQRPLPRPKQTVTPRPARAPPFEAGTAVTASSRRDPASLPPGRTPRYQPAERTACSSTARASAECTPQRSTPLVNTVHGRHYTVRRGRGLAPPCVGRDRVASHGEGGRSRSMPVTVPTNSASCVLRCSPSCLAGDRVRFPRSLTESTGFATQFPFRMRGPGPRDNNVTSFSNTFTN
jgi:hypothetical protein